MSEHNIDIPDVLVAGHLRLLYEKPGHKLLNKRVAAE